LSPDAILDAALAVLDDAGLEGFTMRALARRLEADPMAVYRHYDGKEALLAALCDRVLADLAPLDAQAPWRDQLEALATAIRARMLEHRGLVPVLTAAPVTPATAVIAEQMVGALAAAGFDDAAVADGLGALLAYILGFVAVEHADPAVLDGAVEAAGTDTRLRRTLQWGRGDRDFGGGLRLLLDGLAARHGAR
jgi:AcrR family transcriptional regulator